MAQPRQQLLLVTDLYFMLMTAQMEALYSFDYQEF